MGRPLALAAALAVPLLAVAGAGGAAAQQTPKRGGTVVHGGSFGEPACLTPFLQACIPGSTALVPQFVTAKVLDGAFELGPDFTMRPNLVSSVDIATRPGFALTYHIRPEARWSDGVPVSARDFAFTHRAFVRASAPDSSHPMVTTVRSVTAIDAKTVRVDLRSPLASWQELFLEVLPRHALEGEELDSVWRDGIENPKTGSPIGSGPFLVERWERGKQFTLRRNPQYWGPHPAYLDRIVVRFQVTGPSLRDTFRRGEIDVATHMPPGVIPGLRGEAGLRVISNQRSPGWDHLELRLGTGGHPALRNKLVRRALAFGVDRAAIVRSFLLGSDPKAEQRDSAVFATRSPYYQRNWRRYEYRPSESRRLLELAGCRRGPDGVYSCDGRRLSLRFVTTVIPGGFRPAVLELVQTQLRRVGVEATLSFAPSGALFDQIVRSGDFDIALFAWVPGPSAAHSAQGVFACGGPLNFTGYCQRLVTSQLDEATRILDPQTQARVLNKADRQLARDVPVLPLYQQTQAIAARDSVRNVGLSLITQFDPLWNAENWWLDR